MCVRLHTHTHTHTLTTTHARSHAHMHTHIHTHTRTRTCTEKRPYVWHILGACLHTHTYTHMHTHTHPHARTHACTRTRTRTRTHIHTHIHTHTHLHTHARNRDYMYGVFMRTCTHTHTHSLSHTQKSTHKNINALKTDFWSGKFLDVHVWIQCASLNQVIMSRVSPLKRLFRPLMWREPLMRQTCALSHVDTDKCTSQRSFVVQPITFGVSLNLNLQSQSHWSVCPQNVAKETC